ncbi:ribonuclease catalytic domain-containing protein [Treponema sp.]|uniref:ribonuclease catalytic domain-containing protein n=1 Tax=Treponema sp. TaxID=166 RepID=UPI003F0A8125
MIKVNSLVIYKNAAAVVVSVAENNKFTVRFQSAPPTGSKPAAFDTQNVRSKDILLLDEGPVSSLEAVLKFAQENSPLPADIYNLDQKNDIFLKIKDCYELLSSEEQPESYSFGDLVSLFYGELKHDEAWGLYTALKNTVYFTQVLKEQMNGRISFSLRSRQEIDQLVKKGDAKEKEAKQRAEFFERLKAGHLLPGDSVFMGDVESLALGKSDKSRTMHDAGLKETPERAHRLLLDTGIWDITRNPYPLRWGLSTKSASVSLDSPPEEERLELDTVSYAIDNEWSSAPDDAVAFDGKYLWVHIADPASSVLPDSQVDKSARARGATLYIPEGASRMLSETCLEDYALGLNEKSRALSFRILLDENGAIEDCSVFKTLVKVKRLFYEQADTLMESEDLKPLFCIAQKNEERRKKSGAVQISMPEVHIIVDPETKKVSIEPAVHPKSSKMIQEMMLLAGEGAAKFAFKNNIPFPFISQEAPSIPADLPDGLAGQFRLRRCMRKRSVDVTPGMHCALGLNMYSQVTSPLRRYGDLIAHIQLRAFLDKRPLLDKDTMLIRISEGDAGAQAVHKAERKSNMHWTLVYLMQNPDWTGDAVCVDNGMKLPLFSIPSLAVESFISCPEKIELNDSVKVKVRKIDIAEQQLEFEVC